MQSCFFHGHYHTLPFPTLRSFKNSADSFIAVNKQNIHLRAEEMVWWVKWLLSKQEDKVRHEGTVLKTPRPVGQKNVNSKG